MHWIISNVKIYLFKLIIKDNLKSFTEFLFFAETRTS